MMLTTKPNSRRKFAETGLTHSTAHHLVAVKDLLLQRGYARVTDVARQLGITRGSASVTLHWLGAAGYLRQDDSRFFHLTAAGERAARSVQGRHEVLECVLREVLGLSDAQAHRQSCQVEHILDRQTTRRFVGLLRFWRKHDLGQAFLAEMTSGRCRGQPTGKHSAGGMECSGKRSQLPPRSSGSGSTARESQ